ncbi:hypothetical protein SDC9_131798 [bioreactor metagenome]|uniref:Uncharacterized protein n=1 Tax=bioreactor metagenome TaxID=1076179 RepID=A0A645D7Y8_9ZZZZ
MIIQIFFHPGNLLVKSVCTHLAGVNAPLNLFSRLKKIVIQRPGSLIPKGSRFWFKGSLALLCLTEKTAEFHGTQALFYDRPVRIIIPVFEHYPVIGSPSRFIEGIGIHISDIVGALLQPDRNQIGAYPAQSQFPVVQKSDPVFLPVIVV